MLIDLPRGHGRNSCKCASLVFVIKMARTNIMQAHFEAMDYYLEVQSFWCMYLHQGPPAVTHAGGVKIGTSVMHIFSPRAP